MKVMDFYRHIVVVLFLGTVASCGVSTVNPDAKNIDDVYFFQNRTSIAIADDVAQLKLKRQPFAIQFFNKAFTSVADGFNVTRIVAVPNQAELDKITIGLDAEKTVNLEKFSALAVSKKNGYDGQLFINDYGHHILYYTNDEERTVDVIGKKADYLLFQFEVALIFDKPDFIPISETAIEKLYFAIYSDFNQNKIIDAGELKKITVQLY